MPTLCHLIFSPGAPYYNVGKGGVPKGAQTTISKGAKSQSLCVPAHACASSCLAGFHPQLASTRLPRAGTQQPQAVWGAHKKPSSCAGALTGPGPHTLSTAHITCALVLAWPCASGTDSLHSASKTLHSTDKQTKAAAQKVGTHVGHQRPGLGNESKSLVSQNWPSSPLFLKSRATSAPVNFWPPEEIYQLKNWRGENKTAEFLTGVVWGEPQSSGELKAKLCGLYLHLK